MEYRNFILRIQAGEQDDYRAEVLASPGGQLEGPTDLRWSAEQIETRLGELDASLVKFFTAAGNAEARRHPVLALRQDHCAIGHALFQELFVGLLGQSFDRSLESVTQAKAGLRIQLVYNPHRNHLAALPWELLYRREQRDHLELVERTLVVRSPEVPRPARPLELEDRLRVLVLAASPDDLSPTEDSKERREIRRALERYGDVDTTFFCQPNLLDLFQLLRQKEFHVLHFIGHAFFSPETGESCLALVEPPPDAEEADAGDAEADERGAQWVPSSIFAECVKEIDSVQLVVLNSCHTGSLPRRHGGDPFSSAAAALMLAGVPAVVAMQFPISHRAGIAFSRAFYASLGRYRAVDLAVSAARQELHITGTTTVEWATPALFMRSPDGQGGHRPGAPGPRRNEPLQIGIRSFAKGFGEGMEETCELFLDLGEHFEQNRYIRDRALWQEAVFPELRELLNQAARLRRPIRLDLAAHASIAFAAGYCLEEKSGLDVEVYQRGPRGAGFWWSHDGPLPEDRLWCDEEDRTDLIATGPNLDVALAIGISRPVLPEVEEYVRSAGLNMHRILPATVAPEPGGRALDSGSHALLLAQQLARRACDRSLAERRGVLHVFAAAPNVFMFYLGQVSRGFGRVQLYEYPFGSGRIAEYEPSITLPSPGDAF